LQNRQTKKRTKIPNAAATSHIKAQRFNSTSEQQTLQ